MRQTTMLLCAVAITALLFSFISGAYQFSKGHELLVIVKELTSSNTQLPFCKPDNPETTQTYGASSLLGPYLHFQMGVPKTCQLVRILRVGEKEADDLMGMIRDGYRFNMVLDNLPLVVPITVAGLDDENTVFYQQGCLVGAVGQYAGSGDRYFVNNHLSFLVKYETDYWSGSSRIVAFEVTPFSVKHQFEGQWDGANTRLSTCHPHAGHERGPQEVKVGENIVYTYDVSFEEYDISVGQNSFGKYSLPPKL